jgi:hypothetical protein
MMEATLPVFMLIAIAVGAGLLAVMALWLSKQIANAQTRRQGITVAVVALACVALGLFMFVGIHADVSYAPPSATVVPNSPTPPGAPQATTFGSGAVMDSNGRMEVHVSAAPAARPVARFAWGPLTIGAAVIGIIVLVSSSKRGLPAALAGLGIVGALFVIYFLRSSATSVARMPPAHEIPLEQPPATSDAPSESVRDAGESGDKPSAVDAPEVAEKADKPRPAWVGSSPKLENGVYYAAVESGPYSTTWEAEGGLDDPLRETVRKYAERYMPSQSRWFAWSRIDLIKSRLVKDRYVEQVQASFGPMVKLHALVEIDPNDRAYFDQLAYQAQVRNAVANTSVGAACIFGALVVLYGGLRYGGRKKPTAETSPTAQATA